MRARYSTVGLRSLRIFSCSTWNVFRGRPSPSLDPDDDPCVDLGLQRENGLLLYNSVVRC